MRLLTWDSQGQLRLVNYPHGKPPHYAILSHTWGSDGDEVTFDDIQAGHGQDKTGYAKILFCGNQARRDQIEYFWVDTCCIDKKYESEISTAIRSMFDWYKNAKRCYVYLSDVSTPSHDNNGVLQNSWEASFRLCRWFTRGWTLQELLAPEIVQFFSREENFLGDKKTLAQLIHEITTIPKNALEGIDLDQFPIDEKIRWANMRQTTIEEDGAYCLLGIFKVHMPLMYAEGRNAFFRLRNEINNRYGSDVAAQLGNTDHVRPAGSHSGTVLLHKNSGLTRKAARPHQMAELSLEEEPIKAKRVKLSDDTSDLGSNHCYPPASTASRTLHTTTTNRPVQDFNQATQAKSMNSSDSDALHKSLAFNRIDFRINNVKRPLSSTCQWLFRHTDFQQWYNNDRGDQYSGFFWIKGKPGCGKSTLMKAALEWVLKQDSRTNVQKTVIPYFFNARASASLEKSRLGLYRTVVYHLVSAYPWFRKLFNIKFALKDPELLEDSWTTEELEGFLEEAIESNNPFKLYLFIDALDEAEYSDDIRQMIGFLIQLSERVIDLHESCKLRICLSSRHYPYIKIRRGLSLTLEDQLEHGHDIEKYITRELTYNDPDRDDLQVEILNKSAGIFLWVVLVVKILNKLDEGGSSLLEMRTRLETIPEDLNELFAEILTKNVHDTETCILLFQWMAFRTRPLEPAELFVAIEYSKSPVNETWSLSNEITVPPPERLVRFIVNHSRGLVEVSSAGPSQAPVVQFIHETVREFLLTENGLALVVPYLAANIAGISHETLRTACLRRVPKSGIPQKYQHYQEATYRTKISWEEFLHGMRHESPFLDYATVYLLDHAEQAQKHGRSQQRFIQDQNNCWVDLYRPWRNLFERFKNRRFDKSTSFTHFLVDRGHLALLLQLVSASNTANAFCKKHGSVLYMASISDNAEAVQILLDGGAIIDALGGSNGAAIHGVSKSGHKKIVQILLDRGADANAGTDEYYTALQLATDSGYEKIVQILLEGGADANARKEKSNTALQSASQKGHERIVQMLLDRGADIDAGKGEYHTALQLASQYGHEKIVQMLLDRGADIDARKGEYYTALQSASQNGRESKGLIVLDRSPDIDAGKDKALVQMLRDRGADMDAGKGEYRTALQLASQYGHEKIVHILLDRGADMDAGKGEYYTALQLASQYGHEKIVQMLLDRGADMNAGKGKYYTALQLASENGHEKMVQMLLNRGADVNAGKGEHRTALQMASQCGHEKIVQMLLDRGADIDAGKGGKYTALQLASRKGHEKIVQMLLNRGADVDVGKGKYYTALQLASQYGREKIVQMLLDRGADVNAGKGEYYTALQLASRSGHEKMVQMLLDRGADAKDTFALQLASQKGPKKIVQMLLDRGAV